MAIRYLLEIGDPVTHRFSSSVRSPLDQSNATYPDAMDNVYNYPVRLNVPSVMNKISDSISGTTLLTQYRLSINNQDGKYDDVETLDWFNKPAVLKRSNKENPILEDFDIIMAGELSYPVVMEKSVTLVINNILRALTQESCRTFNITDYPNVFDNVKDKAIPIGYGTLKNVPVYRVDPSEYIALDESYITAVSAVYDTNGNSIAFNFNVTTKRIEAIDAVSADVTGRTNNKIGSIITTEVQEKALIDYNATNWDTIETNEFISNDSRINFYFAGGKVRDLIDSVLKNDNAFFFTKNNGKLTLRRWGRLYKRHTIGSDKIMRFPEKNYAEAQRYFNSSVKLVYEKDIKNNIYDNQILIGDDTLFSKPERKTYMVDLYDLGDLNSLGNRLIQRFGELSEIITLPVGVSTIDIDLLDQIILDININGRLFSKKRDWIVREVDPGQDVLVLEARSGFIEPQIISGVLSQPQETLSQPQETQSRPIAVLE